MITISQLAGFAGVTVKAIRHYHQRGLLEEPPRDSSGYRRYSARHAIILVKIKTLADAGLSLTRIKELMVGDLDQLAAVIAETDLKLQERVVEIQRTRERLSRLRDGDRLFVSAEVGDYLDKLHELGVSQRGVQMERDIWILMQSVAPKEAATWISDKCDMLSDPEFCGLYLDWDAAFEWSADDPRLYTLADRTRGWMTNQQDRFVGGKRLVQDPTIAQLVATFSGTTSPAWDRLSKIAKQGKPGQRS